MTRTLINTDEAAPQCEGEYLAYIAEVLRGSHLIVAEVGPDQFENDTTMAIIRLALVIRSRPTVLVRSVVEEWDLQRIVRELY